MDISLQSQRLREYHAYLDENYTGGIDRFFSPTGSLEKFESTIAISSQKAREHVYVRTMDEAFAKLQPVVTGGEGVFDLTAEPGSGKTSVLPFRFAGKCVIVALPTPFLAWSAFQMATGKAMLRLKGLSLGADAKVCYTDSYYAAKILLTGYMKYDILIVDECDSGKGVTGFLSEVKAPGKVLIRMSASHGRTSSGPSQSFAITEDTTLPDVRAGVKPFAEAVREKAVKRSLVLAPDAIVAKQVHNEIPGAILVTTDCNLGDIATALVDQNKDAIFISDDACARGLNLNLDVVFDTQLITEYSTVRNLTDAELYQRKGRVGRNKPGWYISPGMATIKSRLSDADVLRNNVMRVHAGIEQLGSDSVRMNSDSAAKLLCSAVEPITVFRVKHLVQSARVAEVDEDYGLDSVASRRNSMGRSSDSDSSGSSQSSRKKKISPPTFLSWMLPDSAKQVYDGKSYYVCDMPSTTALTRSTHTDAPFGSPRGHEGSTALARRPKHRRHHSRELPVAEDAPYALTRTRDTYVPSVMAIPQAPGTVDLSEINYHMDWPAMMRDRAMSGADLPTIVPPGSWRHTSAGGIGSNWLARLEMIAIAELSFSEAEFEVVCRAWNKIVAQSWVRKSPGLSSAKDEDKVEFCIRYFQSYFALCV